MHRDGQVGWQSPGGGGPDDQGDVFQFPQFRQLRRRTHQGKLHENGRGLVLFVLHLRLGQGGAAGGAPVDGLFAALDGPAEIEAPVFFQDFRHVGRVHGEIGALPIPQHPQTLEFSPLNGDEFFGIVPAAASNLHLGQPELLGLQLFIHLVFDGEAVAIPAGPVRAIEAGHLAALDDDVLEDLVEGVPQVQVAVGVGRAVVEDEPGASAALAAEPGVEVRFGPALQQCRLPPGQVGLHGEIAAGQIQGLFIIHRTASQPMTSS